MHKDYFKIIKIKGRVNSPPKKSLNQTKTNVPLMNVQITSGDALQCYVGFDISEYLAHFKSGR